MQTLKIKQTSIFIYLLGLYFFLIPFDFLGVAEGVSLSKILIVLPLMGVLFELGRFNTIHKKSLPLLIYVIVVGFTFFHTVHSTRTMDRFISVALNTIIIMACALRRYKKEEIDFLIKAVVGSGWLAFILCLSIGIDYLSSQRLSIGLGDFSQDPNYLVGYFFCSIAYYIWRFFETGKKIYLIPNIAFVASILLTGSRGGLIAVALVIVSTILATKKNRSRKVIALLILLGAFFMSMIFILPEYISERFSPSYTSEDGAANRFDIWESCINTFMNSRLLRKLFGYGAASIPLLNAQRNVAHNLAIEFLLEYGVIGCILIYSMLIYYAFQAKKTKQGWLFSAFLGYLALTMSLSLFSYKPIWNAIFLTLLVNRTVYEDNKKEDDE